MTDQGDLSRADLLGSGVGDPSANLAVPPPRRPGKGRWLLGGCLVLGLLTGMAGVVLFVVVPLFAVGGMLTTEGGRELVQVTLEASSAPGTQELMAAGCQSASVMDVGRMADAFGKLGLEDGDDDSGAVFITDLPYVMCQKGFTSPSELDCSAVAVIYAAAVPDAPDAFIVMVSGMTGASQGCDGYYDGEGRFLAKIEDEYRPR